MTFQHHMFFCYNTIHFCIAILNCYYYYHSKDYYYHTYSLKLLPQFNQICTNALHWYNLWYAIICLDHCQNLYYLIRPSESQYVCISLYHFYLLHDSLVLLFAYFACLHICKKKPLPLPIVHAFYQEFEIALLYCIKTCLRMCSALGYRRLKKLQQ